MVNRKRALVILLAVSALSLGVAPAAAVRPTAEQQLRWVVQVSGRLPASPVEIDRHISSVALREIGGPAEVNQALAAIGPLRLSTRLERRPRVVQALVRGPRARYAATVKTDGSGMITQLAFGPYLAAPGSWRGLDVRLRALAPQVGFAAAQIIQGGRCQLVHGMAADRPRPLGSAFKLYVLGALGQAVESHRARWNQGLRIHEAWKSLPSGTLQNAPAGTVLPLRTYADAMISNSDNTAADHLIHSLGRASVQRQLRLFGNRHARRNLPFPTTRELFALKGFDFPAAADRYLALSRSRRVRALTGLDRIPLASLAPWTTPQAVDSIEWFASPSDICRAYAGLARQDTRPGLSPIGQALSINDGGIALNRARYPRVWFKGGSEPGVLTLTYLVRTADHRTLVDAVMLADPREPIKQAATAQMLGLARGGIGLADRATARSAPGFKRPGRRGS